MKSRSVVIIEILCHPLPLLLPLGLFVVPALQILLVGSQLFVWRCAAAGPCLGWWFTAALACTGPRPTTTAATAATQPRPRGRGRGRWGKVSGTRAGGIHQGLSQPILFLRQPQLEEGAVPSKQDGQETLGSCVALADFQHDAAALGNRSGGTGIGLLRPQPFEVGGFGAGIGDPKLGQGRFVEAPRPGVVQLDPTWTYALCQCPVRLRLRLMAIHVHWQVL
mmetsp:Transcript_40794/g.73027  ORF Transcript_40794/g.73027 Transcript_40794/m.73027 type:complete len:222 (+) Transcript_40794:235-900(+)